MGSPVLYSLTIAHDIQPHVVNMFFSPDYSLSSLFLFLLLTDYGQALFDTEGTRFFWNYVRNANPDTKLPNQQLSITVLNGANDGPCDFTFMYKTALLPKNANFTTVTLTVQPKNFTNYPIPAIYGYAYDTEGIQVGNNPTLTLNANATCDVTLIAHNFDNVTNQGDSFVVLPATRWASNYYSFTLPPAQLTDLQYEIVTIIPTERDATVTMTIGAYDPVSFNVTYGDESLSYYGDATKGREAKTYQIQSTAPIQVVAGVTCVGNYNGPCDHIAFMPQPLPAQECYLQAWQDDDHVTDLITANSFFVDIPNDCSLPQNILMNTTKKVGSPVVINPYSTSPMLTYDSKTYGRAVYFHAETSSVHVSRLYNLSPQGGQGAYMTVVPSITQYIKTPSYFYTVGEMDTIEIICNSGMCVYLQLDGVSIFTNLPEDQWDTIYVDGLMYLSGTCKVNGSGFHTITLSAKPVLPTAQYVYYVYGTGDKKYGYTGHVFTPSVVLIPSPTPPITYSTPTTPTPAPTTSTTVTTPTTKPTVATTPTTVTTPTTTVTTPTTTVTTPTTTVTTPTTTVTTPTTTVTTPTTTVTTPTTTVTTPTTTVTTPTTTVTTPTTTVTTPTTTVTTPTTTVTTPTTTVTTPTTTVTTPTTTVTTPTTTVTTPTTTVTTPTTTVTTPTTTVTTPTTTVTTPTTTVTTPTTTVTTPTTTVTTPTTTVTTPTTTVTTPTTTVTTPTTTVTTPTTTVTTPTTTVTTRTTTVTTPTTTVTTPTTTVTTPTTTVTTPTTTVTTPTTTVTTPTTTVTTPTTTVTTPTTTVTTPTTTVTTPTTTVTTRTTTVTTPTTTVTTPTTTVPIVVTPSSTAAPPPATDPSSQNKGAGSLGGIIVSLILTILIL